MATKKDAASPKAMVTSLRTGDPVIVLVGGNKKKGKIVKGQTGKILRLLPKRNRVVVEGVNYIKRHKRATSPNEPSGIIQKEGSVHISNVMYYVEELKRPVRIKFKKLDDGRKVRGYLHPESKKFEQIDV
jgi:large subunit ribosomal protein L24